MRHVHVAIAPAPARASPVHVRTTRRRLKRTGVASAVGVGTVGCGAGWSGRVSHWYGRACPQGVTGVRLGTCLVVYSTGCFAVPFPAGSGLALGTGGAHVQGFLNVWYKNMLAAPFFHPGSPHPCPHCTGTGLAPATSAPGLGSPPAASAPGRGSPLPHLHRDWALPCHICTRITDPQTPHETADKRNKQSAAAKCADVVPPHSLRRTRARAHHRRT